MVRIDISALWAKVMDGVFTDAEINAVVEELLSTSPPEPPELLLRILGHAAGPSYAWLVEPYLFSDDCGPAAVALWVLCMDWDLTNLYKGKISEFMGDRPEDPYGDCRRAAVSAAGHHLSKHSDPSLLRQLVLLVNNPLESDSIRRTAYRALRAALKYEPQNYPPTDAEFDANKLDVVAVVEEANTRICEEVRKMTI